MDLEMKVAADRASVAGLPHGAHTLTGPDPLTAVNRGRTRQVGVEVTAILAFAVDQQVVAIEDRVITAPQHPPAACGNQRRATGSNDVKAFMPPPTVTRSPKFTNRPPRSMRPINRKDVAVIRRAPASLGTPGQRRGNEKNKSNQQSDHPGRGGASCTFSQATPER